MSDEQKKKISESRKNRQNKANDKFYFGSNCKSKSDSIKSS